MPIQVTLNIFSGRPNPVWSLSEDHEKELGSLLESIQTPTLSKPSGVLGGLGYRGFSIWRPSRSTRGPLSLYVHEGIIDQGQQEENLMASNRDLEEWLLTTAPDQLETGVKKVAKAGIAQATANAADIFSARAAAAAPACPPCHAADAPIYNPAIWNVPSVQPYNNCYNYANDHITNTFAQPGRAHGKQATKMACPNVQTAAQADGLVPVANFTNPLTAGHGWYVALVIWPNVDYHWYRQDKNGCWSHKPGSTAARNTDNSGHTISDPRTCNRGPYTNFCTYMVTKRGLVIR